MTDSSLFPDDETLDRYLTGTLDRAESIRVDAWLAECRARQVVLDEVRAGVTCMQVRSKISTDDGMRSLFVQLNIDEERAPVVRKSPSRSLRRRSNTYQRSASRSSVARGFTGVLAVGVITVSLWRVGASSPSVSNHLAPQTHERYTTTIGERKKITLSDGSHLTLAPQTTVTIASERSTLGRSVSVDGEAYFDIVSSRRTPLLVYAGAAQARVLGTEFTVRQYPSDREARISVFEGRVAVARRAMPARVSFSSSPIILAAGRMAVINDSSSTVTTAPSDVSNKTWIDGRLTFDRTPLPKVLATLRRWYNVDFRIADSTLATYTVSGTLAHGPVTDMLTTLEDLLDVSLTYEAVPGAVPRVTLRPARRAEEPVRRKRDPFNPPTSIGR